jgi:hypothetical protein
MAKIMKLIHILIVLINIYIHFQILTRIWNLEIWIRILNTGFNTCIDHCYGP